MARETPGQAASTTVLADIEATVDGRCACGCGIQLGPRSDSAWFAGHDCQERWNARNAGIEDDSLSRILARVHVHWVPQVADPDHPTTAEVEAGVDLSEYVVPGSVTFREPDNSGCIFPTRFQTERSPLLLQRAEWREGLIPVPDAPGTYRLVLSGVPLADVTVPARSAWWRRIFTRPPRRPLFVNPYTVLRYGRPTPPWWRRALDRLTRKAS